MTRLFLIWDYDAAIGQINASNPYNFHERVIDLEIENVEKILHKASQYDLSMIFAITGFSAEPGTYPYHIPEQIQKIHHEGHEIASHSWRHEWLPYLDDTQLDKTIVKSKKALEACIEEEGGVVGFVPPFNRPMSWRKYYAWSRGDRCSGKAFPGSDLSGVIHKLSTHQYAWIRVSYRPLLEKLLGKNGNRDLTRSWNRENGLLCVPNNYVGFDEQAMKLLDRAIVEKKDLVISGHPAALSLKHAEKEEYFNAFIEHVLRLRDQKKCELQLLKNICKN